MTNFVCIVVAPIFAELDRLVGRAMLRFWMASLREQLQRERGDVWL